MIKAGYHNAKVVEHGIGTGKNAPQVIVKFDTEEGEITGYFSLSDKAAEYTIKKVRAMGFQGDDMSQLNDGECILGNFCDIQVVHDDSYDGTMRVKVGFVNASGSGGGGVSHDEASAGMAMKFNALLKKEPKVAQPDIDEDLPF